MPEHCEITHTECHPVFTLHKYADISTAYLTETDLGLLVQAKACFAETKDKAGCYLYISHNEREWLEQLQDASDLGLSARFLEIMAMLREQDIPYVRFDQDGGSIEGLDPVHGHEALG